MKVWLQHGSEHSANLVMIGHFESAEDASSAKEILDAISEQVSEDQSSGDLIVGTPTGRYGEKMLNLLAGLNTSIGPLEVEQFAYEVNVKLDGNDLVITTDELEISAFLKVMFNKGARIEVYSAHYHPDTTHGR